LVNKQLLLTLELLNSYISKYSVLYSTKKTKIKMISGAKIAPLAVLVNELIFLKKYSEIFCS